MGIPIRMYLDDWLILVESQELCRSQMGILLSATGNLGFQTNLDKSDLIPSQKFALLGMSFDTVLFTVAPAQTRRDRLLVSLSALSTVAHALASIDVFCWAP